MLQFTYMQWSPKITNQELKVTEYILDFMEKEYFTDNIKALRKKYGIPESGYKITEKNLESISKSILTYIPAELNVKGKDGKALSIQITKDLNVLFKEKLEISSLYSSFLFKYFFFFNDKDFSILEKYRDGISLIKIRDLKIDIDDGLIEECPDVYDNKPIAITLHPETTKRDLLDFVEQRWIEIEARLLDYKTNKSKLKNIRIKKPKARLRDQIIYENKDKSIKEISSELGKVKIPLDFGNISNYKKKIVGKRKKV